MSNNPIVVGYPTPVVEARLEHETNLTPDGLAAVLVPDNGEKLDGQVILHWTTTKLSKYSKVVVSACEGDAQKTNMGKATVEVLGVVPSASGLEILLRIQGGPIDYRAHMIYFL